MKNNDQDFPPSLLDENRTAVDQNEKAVSCILQKPFLPEEFKTLVSHIILLALPTPSAHLH
jgi:hypothetical protein